MFNFSQPSGQLAGYLMVPSIATNLRADRFGNTHGQTCGQPGIGYGALTFELGSYSDLPRCRLCGRGRFDAGHSQHDQAPVQADLPMALIAIGKLIVIHSQFRLSFSQILAQSFPEVRPTNTPTPAPARSAFCSSSEPISDFSANSCRFAASRDPNRSKLLRSPSILHRGTQGGVFSWGNTRGSSSGTVSASQPESDPPGPD